MADPPPGFPFFDVGPAVPINPPFPDACNSYMDINQYVTHHDWIYASPNLERKRSMRRGIDDAETIEERRTGFSGIHSR